MRLLPFAHDSVGEELKKTKTSSLNVLPVYPLDPCQIS